MPDAEGQIEHARDLKIESLQLRQLGRQTERRMPFGRGIRARTTLGQFLEDRRGGKANAHADPLALLLRATAESDEALAKGTSCWRGSPEASDEDNFRLSGLDRREEAVEKYLITGAEGDVADISDGFHGTAVTCRRARIGSCLDNVLFLHWR